MNYLEYEKKKIMENLFPEVAQKEFDYYNQEFADGFTIGPFEFAWTEKGKK